VCAIQPYQVALHYMHHNVVRIDKTLRVTPAMEAGVTDRLWTVEGIAGGADIVFYVGDSVGGLFESEVAQTSRLSKSAASLRERRGTAEFLKNGTLRYSAFIVASVRGWPRQSPFMVDTAGGADIVFDVGGS